MRRDTRADSKAPGKFALIFGSICLLLASVMLAAYVASPPKIVIEWETESEFETAGYNLYRSPAVDGTFAKLNERLIPSKGDTVTGAEYAYIDEDVERGNTYYYRLEDVGLDSKVATHDVIVGEVTLFPFWAILLTVVGLIAGCAVLVFATISVRR
jgi:hypothetical protein